MQFFIPSISESEMESAYLEMKRSLIDQLRCTIQDRRIFKMSYTNSKRNWQIEVGKTKPQESQYIATAIFEAGVFIIVHQTTFGDSGPIVLVDKDEVTAVEEFKM